MTLSWFLLTPLDKMDFSKIRKAQGLKKSRVELGNLRSWDKTQQMVTLLEAVAEFYLSSIQGHIAWQQPSDVYIYFSLTVSRLYICLLQNSGSSFNRIWYNGYRMLMNIQLMNVQFTNEELSHVNDWFALNKLSLNLKKTNYILFRSHRKPIPSNTLTLHINNVEIPKVSSTKFLGILVDQFLTWSDHISNITSKISRNLGILSRITYLLPQHIRKNLYYTMIHPYISYCNIVWASNYPTKLLKLHSLQNRAVRMVFGPTCRLSTDLMYKEANILKLDQICMINNNNNYY